MPHREGDASQPVLYENTVTAYDHFFGAAPPVEWWPTPEVVFGVATTSLDGKGEEEGEERVDVSGRRTAFVRTEERKFQFAEED